MPAHNRAYWKKKLTLNKKRDQAACAALTTLGWKVRVFWECELQNLKRTERNLRTFLR